MYVPHVTVVSIRFIIANTYWWSDPDHEMPTDGRHNRK